MAVLYGLEFQHQSSGSGKPHILSYLTSRSVADDALFEVWNGATNSDRILKLTWEGQLQVENGTAAKPSYSFDADKDSGRYMSGAGTFLDVVAGTAVGTWTAGKLTLVELQVDNLNINGNTLSSTAGTDLLITPLSGQQIVLDGTIVIDAGVVTGATSVTSTAFVGDITGDVTGNADTATLATSITASANNTADETVYPAFVDGATGTQGIETDTGLTYNPSSGTLTSAVFVGALTGAVTGTASVATVANTVVVVDSTDTTSFIAMFDSATGSLAVKTDGGLLYNSGTGMLTATGFTGPLTGVAATATALATARTIGGTSFDGTANIAVALAAEATALETARTIGGTSFDGTANIAVALATLASTVTVAASGGDTTSHIAMFDSATGSLAVKTDPGITYNATSNVLTAAGFVGPITGAVTGNADTATLAATVTVIDSTDTSSFIAMFDSATGSLAAKTDGGLTYNSGTGMLTATGLTGPLTGLAATATALETARTIGGTSFDGTANIAVALAATATALASARTIGGTSFDGTANIAVALATLATTVTITDNESTNEDNALIFTAGGDVDGGSLGLESDGTLTYNPSSGTVTATAFAGALTGAVTGTADVATVATTVTITDNESTDEDNAVIFTAGGDVDGGNLGLESDGTFTYNPSDGLVTATAFAGALTGNVTGNASGSALTVTQAAQTAITSVGTLTSLAVGNITSSGNFVTTDTGPHSFGGSVSGVSRMQLTGAYTSDGSSSLAMALNIGGALTGASGDTAWLVGQYFANSIVTQTATEDIAVIAQAYFAEPTITDNLTGDITQASTVYIASAPTEGEMNSALHIESGPFSMGAAPAAAGSIRLPKDWSIQGRRQSSGDGSRVIMGENVITGVDILDIGDNTSGRWASIRFHAGAANTLKLEPALITSDVPFQMSNTLKCNNNVWIGDSANANTTLGLTINQGANDDLIFCLKSSDVATGITTIPNGTFETDDFFAIDKRSAAYGGARLTALAEDDASQAVPLQFDVWGGQAQTGKATSNAGLVDFAIQEHDGSNAVANITANGNVFGVRAQVGGSMLLRFLVDEDGDLYSVTSAQTFDEHDDLQLVRNYDVVRRDSLRNSYKEFASGYEDELIALGVLGAPIADGGLTNVTQLQRLHNGALVQLNGNIKALEDCLRGLVAANPNLEGGTEALALLETN